MTAAQDALALYLERYALSADSLAQHISDEKTRTRLGAVPTLGVPLFLDAHHEPMLANAAEQLASALSKVGSAFLERGEWSEYVHLSTEKRALMALDSDQPHCGAWRFDCVFDPSTGALQFVECNGGDPSGMGWVDRLLRIFLALPPLRDVGKKYTLTSRVLLESHAAWMMERYRAWGGLLPPALAFVCADDSFVRTDHECMAEDYRAMGWDAVVADPREFLFSDDRLTLNGQPRTLIYRDTVDEFVLPPHAESARNIVRAYTSRSACVLNPFSSVYSDDKGLFAVLSQHNAAHVPWTRLVQADTPLPPRADLVLKPNDGYGGFDVVIGRDVTDAQWTTAWQRATNAPGRFIAQKFVPLPTARLPSLEGGRHAGFADLKVTFSIWTHGGRYAGCFARAATQNVINVHQGGGIVPVVFVSRP